MSRHIEIVTQMRDFARAEIDTWVKRKKRKPRNGLSIEDHHEGCDTLIRLWIHREQAYEYVLHSLATGKSIHAVSTQQQPADAAGEGEDELG